jgi:glycosyltransferase involved in cell wall biosynthesis
MPRRPRPPEAGVALALGPTGNPVTGRDTAFVSLIAQIRDTCELRVERFALECYRTRDPKVPALSRKAVGYAHSGWRLGSARLRGELQPKLVIFSPNGGSGTYLDLALFQALRNLTCPTVVHHNELGTVVRPSASLRRVVGALRGPVLHVTQCEDLAHRGADAWHGAEFRALHNSALLGLTVDPRTSPVLGGDELRLGFMSDYRPYKGPITFGQLAVAARRQGMDVHVHLAGRAVKRDARKLKAELLSSLRRGGVRVIDHGFVTGPAKSRFWNSIDAFIYPSTNDTEAIVITEALLSGTPVLAREVGCIGRNLGEHAPESLIGRDDDFVEVALRRLADARSGGSEAGVALMDRSLCAGRALLARSGVELQDLLSRVRTLVA